MNRAPRGITFNLGLRLYMLLVAIVLPTLFVYYVYNFRTIEAIHALEVDDMIRVVSLRLHDRLPTSGKIEELRSKRRKDALTLILKERMPDADGLRNVSVLLATKDGQLQFISGNGKGAMTEAGPDDVKAFVENGVQTVTVELEGREHITVSAPLMHKAAPRGVVHFQMLPQRPEVTVITEVHDRIRSISTWLEAWVSTYDVEEDLREVIGDVMTPELQRIVEGPSGLANISVLVASPGGTLNHLASYGPGAMTGPSGGDAKAVIEQRVQKINVQRGGKEYVAVSSPLIDNGNVRAVLHFQMLPQEVGLGPRVPELRANLVLGAGAMLLILALGVALFFQFAVRRPITELTTSMGQATEGNLNAIVDLHGGEFGWLATSYNQMIRQLKGTLDENRQLLEQIQGFNEELKRKIAAATEELAAKNLQLQAVNEKLFVMQRHLTTQEKLATLGEVAAIIAHELGTPLNAISGHLQLLLQDQVADPKVVERLKVIDGQVDRLTAIIREVLKAMRVPPPRPARVDLKKIVRGVAELVQPVTQKRGIVLEVQANGEVPQIEADADQIQQVLMNLFTNGMDAMDQGGWIRVSSAFVSSADLASVAGESAALLGSEAHVRIDVADTGRGMDATSMSKAFEPFYTAKRIEGDTGPSMGLGLGLAICRQIVRNHHGDITVKSETGKGTVFTIYLPVEQPRAT